MTPEENAALSELDDLNIGTSGYLGYSVVALGVGAGFLAALQFGQKLSSFFTFTALALLVSIPLGRLADTALTRWRWLEGARIIAARNRVSFDWLVNTHREDEGAPSLGGFSRLAASVLRGIDLSWRARTSAIPTSTTSSRKPRARRSQRKGQDDKPSP